MTPEKISSEQQIPKGTVELPAELRHRHRTTIFKLVAAMGLVAIGLILAISVVLGANPSLDSSRDKAWTLVTVIVSSALGYLYGSRERD